MSKKNKAPKLKMKTGLDKINKVLLIIFAVLLVGVIIYVSLATPKGTKYISPETEFVDEVKIDKFVAGTYGGVDFKTPEDVVNYYNEAYNYTKTLTAQYITEDGSTATFYKLVGDEKLTVENLLVEGNSNDTINGLVPGILDMLFKGNVKGLSPSDNRDPNLDTRNDGAIDLKKSLLTPDDVLACNVKDNKDGTITITIQPKAAELSMPGEDSQGRFFNVLGDITETVKKISLLSFSQGEISDNFKVMYSGGSGVIKINTKTKEVMEADYVMNVHIDVTHANVTVLKDKNASLDVVYKNHFPASDEYLMTSKQLKRK